MITFFFFKYCQIQDDTTLIRRYRTKRKKEREREREVERNREIEK
jgi:hypothetical protein